MKIRGHSNPERILQAAADGKGAEFFDGLPSQNHGENGETSPKNDGNSGTNSNTVWWFHVYDVTHGCSVLHWAAGMGHLHLVRHFLTATRPASLEHQRDGDNNNDNNNVLNVNQPAIGNSQGRTALHYACRNGHLDICRFLVEECHAMVNPVEAHHGVTPFHLAVWRNHLPICQYLVDKCRVDATQANVFGCTAIHWLGLVPKSCCSGQQQQQEDGSGGGNSNILQLAQWLVDQLPTSAVHAKQKQGHSVLHKSAWGGHLELAKYFHQVHNMYDDSPDHAGNYAADLADMGGHTDVAAYLREQCSWETVQSCQALGLTVEQRHDRAAIKRAYHQSARQLHPDRTSVDLDNGGDNAAKTHEFVKLANAYRHLTNHGGVGAQSNPKHSLPLLLKNSVGAAQQEEANPTTNSGNTDDSTVASSSFAAQLSAVVLEYGTKGLDISNLRKKWRQLWPKDAFPAPKTGSLKTWLKRHASHVVSLHVDPLTGITRIHCNQHQTLH